MTAMREIAVLRAEDAIPDSRTLEGWGIEGGLEEGRLVITIASRTFALGDSSGRNGLYQAMRLVTPAVAAEVQTDDGLLPPLRQRLTTTVPTGVTALKRMGLTSSEVATIWELRPTMLMAVFPLEMITKVLPPAAWPHLFCFIASGPSEAGKRLNEAIKQQAQQVKASTLLTIAVAAWRLLEVVKDLSEEFRAENDRRARVGVSELPVPPHLDEWSWVPPRPTKQSLIKMGASTERWDTSAVPIERVRQGLKRHAHTAQWGKWQPEDWRLNCRWRALKRLVTLALLSTVAPRADHLRLLDVDDLAWHRFADGSEGWGLRFRGEAMKMRNASNTYWKKLPPDLAAIVKAWIVCSGRELGQEGAPLLISRTLSEPGEQGRRYAYGAMGNFIAGQAEGDGTTSLVPFSEGDGKGYQSHRYRSFITQHVEGLIHAWKLEYPGHPLAGVETKVFAELLLDHGTGDMGYRDYGSGQRYEQIVAVAIELLWESIWGSGALRKGLDVERVRDARERVELLQAKQNALRQDAEEREHAKAELRKRKQVLFAKARRLKGEAREEARFELDHLRDRIDDLNDQISATLRLELQVKDALLQARSEFEQAKTTAVVLDGDIDEEIYAQQLSDALAQTTDQPLLEVVAPMAGELVPADVAELFGVHQQAIWRWRKGRNVPNPRPFDPDHWVMHDKKDFRLPVAAINLAAIPATDPQAALDVIRRKRAALGYSKRSRTTAKPRAAVAA
jgi:hypothetical protein